MFIINHQKVHGSPNRIQKTQNTKAKQDQREKKNAVGIPKHRYPCEVESRLDGGQYTPFLALIRPLHIYFFLRIKEGRGEHDLGE